jgi:hypothetical protein
MYDSYHTERIVKEKEIAVWVSLCVVLAMDIGQGKGRKVRQGNLPPRVRQGNLPGLGNGRARSFLHTTEANS